jgi:hypothetical protein
MSKESRWPTNGVVALLIAALKEFVPEQYGCFGTPKAHSFITDDNCYHCQKAERARQLIARIEGRSKD